MANEITGQAGKNNTEYKKAIKKLKDSEAIINRSPAIYCIWHLSEGLPIEFISGNICQFGYPQDHFQGKRIPAKSIIHPDDHSRLEAETFQYLIEKPKEAKHEFRLLTPEGESRWVEITVTPFFNGSGDPEYFQGVMFDINERKQAQLALQESEERLRELFRNSLDIISVFDKNGIFLYTSPSLNYITGYLEKDLIGRSCFDFVHPDDRKSVTADFVEVVDHKNDLIVTEFRFRHADGSWVYLEALGNNCMDNPAINGIIVSARDITERKRLEEQLSHAQKMEAIGTLAGGIAHDFNNLLMGIQGYISLMLLRRDSGDPEFDKLNNMQSLVQSGADLTAKLLGFARGGQYEMKPADLNELIAKTVNVFGRTKKEITIHQKYEKNIWPVEIDRIQIEQVLINLFVNAWQAMSHDSGDIYVETDNITLNQAEAFPLNIGAGDYVRITITDTGKGMDEETCRRIFEPFFTTKAKTRGAGLGMASTYGIIKEHQGAIRVISELGQGTIFRIYLPASMKEVPREIIVPFPVIKKGTETILLIDDEASIIDVCGEILDVLGYKVLKATGGKEALNIYEQNKGEVDLVILDMIMPGLSGSETFDALKLLDPEVRVILSTGYSVSDHAKKIMEKGCQALIQKPFRMDDLSQKIREVLGKTS